MRTIERTTQFKRDYKRERKGAHQTSLHTDFAEVLKALADDQPLAEKHQDHQLSGNWKDHRDCHIKPDLVLIYRKLGHVLQLVRYPTGSTSRRR